MIKRPLLLILLGYILGIIFGLYCKNSIAIFIVFLNIMVLKMFIHISKCNKNISRYVNILKIKKAILYIIISLTISFLLVRINLINEEKITFKMENSNEYIGTVISNPIIEDYKTEYKIKIEKIGDETKCTTAILSISNSKNINPLNYGSKVIVYGEFQIPEVARNDKGFSYKEYLRSIGIVGKIKVDNLKIIKENNTFFLNTEIYKLQNIIVSEIKTKIENENHQSLILGLLLGKDDLLDKKIVEDFQNSSIAHILAVSGMHVTYIMTFIAFLLNKIDLRK